MKARYIIIPIVILGVAALTTWLLMNNFSRQPKYDLFEVRRGDVTKTVSVSGSVVSDQKLELSFLSPGLIKEVKVKMGDKVAAGDILVIQDTAVLQAQANQARAGIAAASSLLSKARNHLRPADMNVLNRSLDNARIALETARNNLQDAYRSRDNDRRSAEVALNSAQTAYQNALNAYNAQLSVIDQSTVGAQIALNNALSNLTNAQTAYNQVMNRYNMGQATLTELQQAQTALSAANAAYLSARTAYDSAVRQANLQKITTAGSLDAARSQLEGAQAAYNSAVSGSDFKITAAQNASTAAEAAYALAEAQYQQSLAPALGADVSSASAQVASAVATLRIVEAQIAKATIKAPISGVVTAVNAQAHEISPMSGPAIILETDGVFQVEAYVSEMDVEKISVGQPVKLSFDALSNVTAQGVVAVIDPAATILLGVVDYKIKVALPETVANLKPAMTANLDILTDQRSAVLFVPRKALTKTTTGYTVKVAGAKEPEIREVQIGLMGDSEVEIVSGLAEGEKIVLGVL
ncbi:MAG: HlyD family efflux transporter periplasmic adaptor subunit [Patescibacteria group bacterium]|jgi:HlyD family secretion protein